MKHYQNFELPMERSGTVLSRDLEIKGNEWLIEAVENIGKKVTGQTVEIDADASEETVELTGQYL